MSGLGCSSAIREERMTKPAAAGKYSAGVKEYRQAYWQPQYAVKDTDLLACFKITPQPGVPRE